MTYNFADSFDLYAAPADAIPGYWDSGTLNFNVSNVGRFGGHCLATLSVNNSVLLTKSSGVNDAVHHIVYSFKLGGTISTAAGIGAGFTLYDGATAQVSVGNQRDGSIIFLLGAANSATVLGTYTGAFADNTNWNAFEIEIFIHPTLGSIKVRKNGASSDSFSVTGINTRVSANSYANKLSLVTGPNGVSSGGLIDDFYWRSHITAVAWMGDLRCYVRPASSDVVAQLTPSGIRRATVVGIGGNVASADRVYYSSYISPCDGFITAVTYTLISTSYAGDLKLALYTDNVTNPGTPGVVLAIASNIVTPGANQGVFTFNFSPPVQVSNRQTLWSGIAQNFTYGGSVFKGANPAGQPPGYYHSEPYASFPVSNPGTLTANQSMDSSLIITPSNSGVVNEAPHDGLTTYVYDANPGDNDFYTVAPSSAIPTGIIATTVRLCVRKSDIGARTVTAQMKSGGTTVNSPAAALLTTGWTWAWRTDVVNPDTGLQWNPPEVDAIQFGPVVG